MNLDKIGKVKRSKPFTLLDGVIAVLLIAVAAISAWAIFRIPSKTVTVSVNGVATEYPLDTIASVELDCLTVHIENGEVWVTDAHCADKTCEHTGKINRVGQSIVCLPNGVVVTISGESDLQWELGR